MSAYMFLFNELFDEFELVNFSGTLGEGPSEQNLTKEKKHAFWKELCSPSAKTKKTQKSIK